MSKPDPVKARGGHRFLLSVSKPNPIKARGGHRFPLSVSEPGPVKAEVVIASLYLYLSLIQ